MTSKLIGMRRFSYTRKKDGQTIEPITTAQKEAKYQQALKDQHDGNFKTAF